MRLFLFGVKLWISLFIQMSPVSLIGSTMTFLFMVVCFSFQRKRRMSFLENIFMLKIA